MIVSTQTVEVRVVREAPLARLASPREVFEYMVKTYEADTWPEERFYVLCLDTQNQVRHVQEVTRGIVDASVVHPREVFWLAVHERATSVMLIHNHPSGDPTPSPADREITRQLVEAGKILGIPIRDHVVIGDGRFVSFLDLGLLEVAR